MESIPSETGWQQGQDAVAYKLADQGAEREDASIQQVFSFFPPFVYSDWGSWDGATTFRAGLPSANDLWKSTPSTHTH